MSFWWFWTSPPVIEVALDDDLPALAEIHGQSFAHRWDADELARLRDQDGATLLLARRASPYGTRRPLGFLLLRQAADEAEVLTLAVGYYRDSEGGGTALVMRVDLR